jgi:RHS repeat-associated protein
VAGSQHGRNRLVRTFAYDPLYRLTEATGRECGGIPTPRPLSDDSRCGSFPAPYVPGPPTPSQTNAPDLTVTYTEHYEHDPAGNLYRVRHASQGATWNRSFGLDGQVPDDWAHAGRNRLTSIVQGGGTTTLLYDDAGNTVQQDTSRTYDWDHRSRLIAFTTQAGASASLQARYLYGADGARVKKWVRRGATPSNDESIVYIDQLLEHVRWTRDGGGENTQFHVREGETLVAQVRVGGPHPLDAGPAIRFHLADHTGSHAVEVRDDGQWINREEYFPFGETSFGSFSRKRYRFAGRERDEESGLVTAPARHYAPWAMRWLTADPKGPVDGLNLYAYARGSPMTLVDPTGMQSQPAAPAQPAGPATHVVIVGMDFKVFGEWFHKSQTNFPATAKQLLLEDTIEGVRRAIAPGDTVVVIVPAAMQTELPELADDLKASLTQLETRFTVHDERGMATGPSLIKTEFIQIPDGNRDTDKRLAEAVNKLDHIKTFVYVGHGGHDGPMFHNGSTSSFPSPEKFDASKFRADARALFLACNSKSYAERMTTQLHIRSEGVEGQGQFEIEVVKDQTGREVDRYRNVRAIVEHGTATTGWEFRWERGSVVRSGPFNVRRAAAGGKPYGLPQKYNDPFSPLMTR